MTIWQVVSAKDLWEDEVHASFRTEDEAWDYLREHPEMYRYCWLRAVPEEKEISK